MIRYGYACKTIGVPGTEQRGLTLARADNATIAAVITHNLEALRHAVEYCRKDHIHLFRISSDTIPLGSHPDVRFDWRREFKDELASLGAQMRATGLRISMHPGQYTVLNSPNQDVVARSVEDLAYHADFLDALGMDQDARLILHIGGAYGNKAEAVDRFLKNAALLPENVHMRLSLENDERLFTIEDVLSVCERLSMPAIFDVFHHALNPPSSGDPLFWLDRCAVTWKNGSGRQKIHYSQQMPGMKPGTHSRTIGMADFLPFHNSLADRDLDVMLEVKDKNVSAVKCSNLTTSPLPVKRLTDEWARYKYLVLEHSPKLYADIREACFASATPDTRTFYTMVEKALVQEVMPGPARNAAQHVWGYLDHLATAAEKKRILSSMQRLEQGEKPRSALKRAMLSMAVKHGIAYLQQSLYFYL